eukprot:SAG11_NODE_1666_length_4494_cov_53.554949_3_plen_183_part_00
MTKSEVLYLPVANNCVFFVSKSVCTFVAKIVCTFGLQFCVYFWSPILCVLLVLPVRTYLYIRTCIAYPHSVPEQRTCIAYLYRVPVSRTCTAYLYSVPVSRTCTAYLYSVPVSRTCTAYLYCVPWYLVPTLGLPLCEYLPGTLVRYLPWILHLQPYPNQPRVCHRLQEWAGDDGAGAGAGAG